MSYLSFHAGTDGKVNKKNKGMLSGHTFRKTEDRFKTHKNENIDPTQTYRNRDFTFWEGHESDMGIEKVIEKKIERDYTRKNSPRANAVLAREIIIQPSEDVFDGLSEDAKEEKMLEFVKHSLGFFSNEFTTDNILGGSIHHDETNPHAHIWVMPMTGDGGLVQKEFFRGPGDLSRMHREYRDHMNNLGWDFETGNKYENAEHFDYEMMQKHGEQIVDYRETLKDLDQKTIEKREEFDSEVIKVSNTPLIRSEAKKQAKGEILDEYLPKYKAKAQKVSHGHFSDKYDKAIEKVNARAEALNKEADVLNGLRDRILAVIRNGRGTDYNKKQIKDYIDSGKEFFGIERTIESVVNVDVLVDDLAEDNELEI